MLYGQYVYQYSYGYVLKLGDQKNNMWGHLVELFKDNILVIVLVMILGYMACKWMDIIYGDDK